jgi:DNA repair exonuclease SbcCD nuclease subunit
MTDDISAAYPNALPGYFNIGLLHTSLNGREGHASYAPCTMPGLLSHGYNYWALGHVHKREVLHENPYVVFSGNLQGRHARETGEKGCTLVQVKNGKTTLTHVPLDVLRWEVCQLEVNDVTQADDMIDRVREAVMQATKKADGRPLALRVIIEGACPVHNELHSHSDRWVNEIRAVATDAGLGNVWVEKISLQTQPLSINTVQDDGPLEELSNFLRTLPQDGDSLQALTSEFRFLRNALPVEARQRDDGIDPGNTDTIRQLLNGVEELLMARLLAQG